jgi:hypothetical protein
MVYKLDRLMYEDAVSLSAPDLCTGEKYSQFYNNRTTETCVCKQQPIIFMLIESPVWRCKDTGKCNITSAIARTWGEE